MSVIQCISVFIMVLVVGAFSQYRKLSLIESFSNYGCIYCPEEDKLVLDIEKKHFGPAIHVRYQVNWPSASDPMNQFAKADVQSRVNYYKVEGTPTTIFEGTLQTPTHAKIFNKQGDTAPIKIDIRTNPIGDDQILSGEVTITASQERSGNHVLYIAVIERAIIYTKAPGSNGDKEFYDILRKMVTGTGQTIGTISTGTGSPYPFSWTVDVAKVKKEQLAVVAWVQDGATKAIVNAGTSIPTFFIDAQIPEQATTVKNDCMQYLKCSIKNDNQAGFSVKITIRDTTHSTFTDTRLGWIRSIAGTEKFEVTDSIVASIAAGDSIPFWTITATPAATGVKAVFEVFAENRSDPQALGWGCVRYFNVRTAANGDEYPPPAVTGVVTVPKHTDRAHSILVDGTTLAYSLPADGFVSLSLFSLDGAIVAPLCTGIQQGGTYEVDLRQVRLNRGRYVLHGIFNGTVLNRTVMYLR